MKLLKRHVNGFHEIECDCGEKLIVGTDIFFEHKPNVHNGEIS